MYRLTLNCCVLLLILNIVKSSNAAAAASGTPIAPEEGPKFAQCKLKSDDLKLLQKGDQGPAGSKGDQGAQGLPGEKGPAGPKGDPGVCVWSPADLTGDEGDGSKEGTIKSVCKYAGLPEDTDVGVQMLKPKGFTPINVTCEEKKTLTCLLPKKFESSFDFKTDTPFWLSSMPTWTLENIYGVSSDHLLWLQLHSLSVKQVIKYHCLNSVPINDADDSKTLKVLTWNDVLIGPKSSETTPLHYDVINDGCKDSATKKDEWMSTEIEIRSKLTYRLPVADLRVNDVRNEDQKIKIEHVKLCFG